MQGYGHEGYSLSDYSLYECHPPICIGTGWSPGDLCYITIGKCH